MAVTGALCAQDNFEKISLNGASSLEISSHLSTVELLPSNGSQLEVLHEVIINGEAQPDAADLAINRSGGQISIDERRPHVDDLQDEWSGSDDDNNYSRNVEIRLVVKIPRGLKVKVETLYGSLQAEDIAGLEEVATTYGEIELLYRNQLPPAGGLSLHSEYGEIDLSLPSNMNANLELETNYGNLLTDFDIQIDRQRSEDRQFHQEVVGTIGRGGTLVSCRTPYSNVYLRQTK